MKIAVLTPYWVSTTGGITTYVYNFVEELRKIGKTEVVVVTRDKGSGAIGIRGNKVIILFKLPYIMRKIKPDVIHCHDLEVLLLGALLYKILFDRKVKTIYTFLTQPGHLHEIVFLNKKKVKQKAWWKRKLFNFILKKCDLITCGSRVLVERMVNIYNMPIKNFVFTPIGVRKKSVIPSQIEKFQKEYNLKDSCPIICTIGVLVWDWKVKGVEILIEAFAEIVKNYPNAKLLVIGDGAFRKSLELLTKQLEIGNYVVFTGNLENPFIALAITDIYCHLGLCEHLETAALEAMVCGKPVLVTKAGEISMIVEHGKNGMLVEANNVQDVVNNVIKLIENPDMARRVGENARISISKKFAWSNVAEQFMELYNNLVISKDGVKQY